MAKTAAERRSNETMKDQRRMVPGASEGSTRDEVRQLWVLSLLKRGIRPTTDKRTVLAYVNQGRWVANCPECNGGIACWDENPEGACLGCGHVFPVLFPVDHEAITKVLLKRPEENRNWVVGESVEMLAVENRANLR